MVGVVVLWWFFFFFFKQKTAYEIVSRDWSSDVCSSDLPKADKIIMAKSVVQVDSKQKTLVLCHQPPAVKIKSQLHLTWSPSTYTCQHWTLISGYNLN